MAASADMSPIVAAEIFQIPYTLAGYKLSYGTITRVVAVIIKLTDSDGYSGWGEANPQQPFTDESTADVVELLREELLPVVMQHRRPEPAQIDQVLDRIVPAKHLMAKGAISMALLDIQGKRQSVPIATLLGGPLRKSLQVSYALNNGTADDDIAVIDAMLKEGYTDFMLKMGSSPVADEIDRVWTLERRYGDSVTFKADANAGWSREQAHQFLTGVKGSRLAYVEQPVPKNDIEGLAELTKSTELKISADESLTSLARAEEIILKGAASVFSIKSSKNGGPLRAKAMADLAKVNGIDCYLNSMLEGGITQAASLHHACTAENILDIGHAFRSVLRLEGDVTNFASFICNSVVSLPPGPGLGIEVDEERLRRCSIVNYSLAGTGTSDHKS
jgi:o-succinylbenzoate synthase